MPSAAPDCHIIGTTRDFTCHLAATTEEVVRLAQALSLTRVEPFESPKNALERLAIREPRRCELAGSFGRDPAVKLFGLARRPPQLRLASGSAFEYFLLYHHAASARACIESSYAYG